MTTEAVAFVATTKAYEPIVRDIKALADPSRLRILGILARGGEMKAGDVVAVVNSLAQPTVSHHLAALERAGLIASRKSGVHVLYSPRKTAVAAMLRVVRDVANGAFPEER